MHVRRQKENYSSSLLCQIFMPTTCSKLGCSWKIPGRDKTRTRLSRFPPSKRQYISKRKKGYFLATAKSTSRKLTKERNSHYGQGTKNRRRLKELSDDNFYKPVLETAIDLWTLLRSSSLHVSYTIVPSTNYGYTQAEFGTAVAKRTRVHIHVCFAKF